MKKLYCGNLACPKIKENKYCSDELVISCEKDCKYIWSEDYKDEEEDIHRL
jgi:hypothetical protein